MKHNIIIIILCLCCIILISLTTAETIENKPITPTKKTLLFNGKDFEGWLRFIPDKNANLDEIWKITSDGILCCTGNPTGYIRTTQDYADYLFHLEWRWPDGPGNNGVLVHMSEPDIVWPKSLECQLASDNAGDFWVIGGVEIKQRTIKERTEGRRTLKLKPSSENKLGQWNTYEIICKDNWVVVFVNGALQNIATEVSVSSGKICLQSEGKPIEYRNIYIEPLE